ncbi:serine proteinase stubble-like isoform X2 [Hydractinia symbiolongicarpus]|uniref:serine proteinase stubble-like isoform X2 n=1 Tax=Hydractinia symbiolongicarpus TaxID=13093 RepID=UPI00254B6DC6|nr:serine proteinase stubble-like isoform X2 [Hydractinia symbiolongicarpus]
MKVYGLMLIFMASILEFGEGCRDLSSYCLYYRRSCGTNYAYMYKNCRRTCGWCPRVYVPQPCRDVSSSYNCRTWKYYNYCHYRSRYYNSMKYYCKRTCGFCRTVRPTRSPRKTIKKPKVTIKIRPPPRPTTKTTTTKTTTTTTTTTRPTTKTTTTKTTTKVPTTTTTTTTRTTTKMPTTTTKTSTTIKATTTATTTSTTTKVPTTWTTTKVEITKKNKKVSVKKIIRSKEDIFTGKSDNKDIVDSCTDLRPGFCHTAGTSPFIYCQYKAGRKHKLFLMLNDVCRKTCGLCGNAKHCGYQRKRPILPAGMKPFPGGWTWQAAIYKDNNYYCSGALIARRLVLTSLECAKKLQDVSEVSVRLGIYSRNSNEGQEYKVVSFTYYSTPQEENAQHEISILTLETSAILNYYVGLICLPDKDVEEKAECFVTGWDRPSPFSDHSDTLEETKMSILSEGKCKKNFPAKEMLKNRFCGKSSMQKVRGDIGGPLVCKSRTGYWALQGLVYFGASQDDGRHRYTLFTNIYKYRTWINDNIKRSESIVNRWEHVNEYS